MTRKRPGTSVSEVGGGDMGQTLSRLARSGRRKFRKMSATLADLPVTLTARAETGAAAKATATAAAAAATTGTGAAAEETEPEPESEGPPQMFLVPELLEQVLLHLDVQTCLLSQRTCRLWKEVIAASPTLQQHLFFQPRLGTWSGVEANPLLDRVLEDLKIEVKSTTLKCTPRHTNTTLVLAQWHVLDLRWRGQKETEEEEAAAGAAVALPADGSPTGVPAPTTPRRQLRSHVRKQPAVTSSVRPAPPAPRPIPSWRRMLLCQPVLEDEPLPAAEIAEDFNINHLNPSSRKHVTYRGADCGPWEEDKFADMVRYLFAGEAADKGRDLRRQSNEDDAVASNILENIIHQYFTAGGAGAGGMTTGPILGDNENVGCDGNTVVMRLAWGPLRKALTPDRDIFFTRPPGPGARMAALSQEFFGTGLDSRPPNSVTYIDEMMPDNIKREILDLQSGKRYALRSFHVRQWNFISIGEWV